MGLAKISVALLAMAGGALADLQPIEAKVCQTTLILLVATSTSREHISDKTRSWDLYRAPSSSTRMELSST